jgi:hypothetical protein
MGGFLGRNRPKEPGNRHRTPDTRRNSPQTVTGPVGQLSSDLLTQVYR